MKILAIDSSSLVASVAIVTEEFLVAEYTVNFKKTHSQTLLPMIDEIVRMVGFEIDSIDAIAVSGGPGSFTGLRIGSATAKGIGLSLEKPIIHIPTLDAMAYNLFGTNKLICPIMDARRSQVYTGIYYFEDDILKTKKPQCAMSMEELVSELNAYKDEVIFVGDGIPVFSEYIKDHLLNKHFFAPPHLNRQRASSVGALGIIYYKEGKYISADEHEPDYIRLSQAERCLNEKPVNE